MNIEAWTPNLLYVLEYNKPSDAGYTIFVIWSPTAFVRYINKINFNDNDNFYFFKYRQHEEKSRCESQGRGAEPKKFLSEMFAKDRGGGGGRLYHFSA